MPVLFHPAEDVLVDEVLARDRSRRSTFAGRNGAVCVVSESAFFDAFVFGLEK